MLWWFVVCRFQTGDGEVKYVREAEELIRPERNTLLVSFADLEGFNQELATTIQEEYYRCLYRDSYPRIWPTFLIYQGLINTRWERFGVTDSRVDVQGSFTKKDSHCIFTHSTSSSDYYIIPYHYNIL